MSEIIFIHIPKTGGTTINSAMNETYWQTKPGYNYRHILSDKSSNSGDLFLPKNKSKYQNEKIFMMLRHPVDRLVSEYYFINNRNEFTNLIKSKPKTFEEYVESPQTQNYVINFLKGNRMYSTVRPNDEDLTSIIDSIDTLPIHVGIFEQFSESLTYFTKHMGLEWKKDIPIKRMTIRRPKIENLSEELIQLIEKNNALDLKLYEHCLNKFQQESGLKPGKHRFNGDRYDHVLAFAARACLYELVLTDKNFIKQNFNFFKSLTFYLLNDRKIRDGKYLITLWNLTFIKTLSTDFPNSQLAQELDSINDPNPIEHAYSIGKTIDVFFKSNPKEKSLYRNMKFDKALVPEIKTQSKKNWIQKLFKP
jgi:hypothetical protein